MDNSFAIEFTRVFLAVFYTLVAVFYTFRLTRTPSGTKQLVFTGNRFSSTWWNHMTFRFFRLSIWALCVGRLFYPNIDQGIGVFSLMQEWPFLVTGNALLLAGFVLTVAVHRSMGEHWRSGIDPSGPNELLTERYFNYSRNPMFLAVGLAQLGFFFSLPSVFSLMCLLLGWFTLHKQAIEEENHLSDVFNEQYSLYKQRVPRWL